MRHLLNLIVRDNAGTSAVEYAAIAALVAAGSMLAIQGLGSSVTSSYEATTTAVHDANN